MPELHVDVDLVVKIFARVDGAPTPVDGQFIVRYDPMIDQTGAYRLDTTADIDEALGFSRVSEIEAFIRRPSPNVPFDRPGHVNRPITCYHLEILPRVRRP
jgi:hypothetical protein